MGKEDYIHQQHEWLKLTGLKKGDFVLVFVKAESRQCGWQVGWIRQMTDSVGRILKVKNIWNNGHGIQLDDGLKYPFFALVKVEPG